MDHAEHVERIRQIISEAPGVSDAQEDPPMESLLIRDGFYSGRRYRYHDGWAEWRVGEDHVAFYDAAGIEISRVALKPETPSRRQSA
jgi:hypothetical protein